MSKKNLHKLAVILFFLLAVGLFCRSLFADISIFRVVSGSMEPAMPTGSLILVKSGQNSLFEPGEIITFARKEITITHRVMDVDYHDFFSYITKGDANQNPDKDPVPHQQVLGRVVFIMPPLFAILKKTLRMLTTAIALLGILLLLRTAMSPVPKKIGHARRGL